MQTVDWMPQKVDWSSSFRRPGGHRIGTNEISNSCFPLHSSPTTLRIYSSLLTFHPYFPSHTHTHTHTHTILLTRKELTIPNLSFYVHQGKNIKPKEIYVKKSLVYNFSVRSSGVAWGGGVVVFFSRVPESNKRLKTGGTINISNKNWFLYTQEILNCWAK